MRSQSRLFLWIAVATLALLAVSLTPLGSTSYAAQAQGRNYVHFLMRNQPGHDTAAKGKTIPYLGGPVMGGVTSVYTIFWQPTGSKVDPRYDGLLNRFFNDFSQSTVYKIVKQYTDSKGNVSTGVNLGGSWVDTQPYPGKFISDKQLQAEVSHAMKVNGWTSSLQHSFFVFSVKSEPICFDSAGKQCSGNVFCAYHGNFGNVIYSAMPDLLCGTPTSPNHDPEADNVIDSSSHELMESLTDPLGNAWTSNSLGEIGDPCSTTWGKPNPQYNNGDITGHGNFYMVQKEWSNIRHGCAVMYP